MRATPTICSHAGAPCDGPEPSIALRRFSTFRPASARAASPSATQTRFSAASKCTLFYLTMCFSHPCEASAWWKIVVCTACRLHLSGREDFGASRASILWRLLRIMQLRWAIAFLALTFASALFAADVPELQKPPGVLEIHQPTYYWKANDVGRTAQLLTLFCSGCEWQCLASDLLAPEGGPAVACGDPLLLLARRGWLGQGRLRSHPSSRSQCAATSGACRNTPRPPPMDAL